MCLSVVLGGDTPYGLPLIQDLEKKGYIVIASVSTPEAVDVLESKSRGFVKALVLNPSEVRHSCCCTGYYYRLTRLVF
jgi:hypothetical protein